MAGENNYEKFMVFVSGMLDFNGLKKLLGENAVVERGLSLPFASEPFTPGYQGDVFVAKFDASDLEKILYHPMRGKRFEEFLAVDGKYSQVMYTAFLADNLDETDIGILKKDPLCLSISKSPMFPSQYDLDYRADGFLVTTSAENIEEIANKIKDFTNAERHFYVVNFENIYEQQ